ncbi:MAG: TonB-dependent receptor [Pseudomonadota bacterium]
MKQRTKRKMVWTLAPIALLSGGAALAQQAPSATGAAPTEVQEQQMERIVVTATKRSTLLQETPIAVTAYSQVTLDNAGVKDLTSLQVMVPNLVVEQHGDSGGVHVFMRGVGSTNHTEIGDPAVAFHVDGVYSPRPQGATVLMYDLDHVEVARGPQGTLSGRNATAGSINLETAKPRFDKFSGNASAVVGDYNRIGMTTALNIPLSDELALRIAAISDRHDGYIAFQPRSNVVSGQRKYMAGDQLGARITAAWRPSANFDLLAAAEYYRDNGTGNVALMQRPRAGQDIYSAQIDTPGALDQSSVTYRTRMNYRPNDALELSYIGSVSQLKRTNASDNDAGVLPGFKQEHRTEWSKFDNYTHELQLKSADEAARLQWIVGGFMIHEDNSIRFDIDISSSAVPAGLGPIVVHPTQPNDTAWAMSFIQPKRTLDSKAVFGQTSYALNKDFKLTGGARYTVEQKDDTGGRNWVCPNFGSTIGTGGHLIGAGGPVTAATCASSFAPGTWPGGGDNSATSPEESSATYLGRLEYAFSKDVNGYASVSTGFKSGGFGDGGRFYKPEYITNYELGLKSEWFNRALTFNVSAFMMKYKDMQVSSVERLPNGQQQVVTGNAARSSINGVETEFNWRISKQDRLMGNANWLDATYGDFETCDSVYQNCATQSINLKGNKLRHAPTFSLTAAYEHDFALANGKLTPRLSMHYQTKSFVSEFNTTPGAATLAGSFADAREQKAYGTLDAALRYETNNKKWLAEVFVMNATDEAVKTDANWVAAGTPGQTWVGFYNAPRTMGVRIATKF